MTFQNRTAIVVGDSSAAGSGATNKVGWAQQLEQHFHETSTNILGRDCFYNLAVPGETVETTLAAIDHNEVHRRHRFPTLSIISLGGQQVLEDIRNTGEPQLERFGLAMGQLVSRLFEYGNILYVGVTAPNTYRIKGFSKLLDLYSVDEIEGAIFGYEKLAAKIVEDSCPISRNVATVPLFEASRSAFVMDAQRELAITKSIDAFTTAGDGTHPDDIGHSFVFRRVLGPFDDIMELTLSLDRKGKN